jgi:hypothetical protein
MCCTCIFSAFVLHLEGVCLQEPTFTYLSLKVVSSEKIGGSGVISTLGTWYGGVVMGVILPFNEAAILYRDFNSAPSQKQNIIVFAANNSRCCECHVAPTIIFYHAVSVD